LLMAPMAKGKTRKNVAEMADIRHPDVSAFICRFMMS